MARRTPRTDDVLADALAVWDETRCAAVAEAIDALAAKRAWTVPTPRIGREFEAAWRRALADQVGRGWAASLLFERLIGTSDVERSEQLASRLEAIDAVAPDPRTVHVLARQLAARSPLLRFSSAARVAELVLFLGVDERTRAILATCNHPIARRVVKADHVGRKPTRSELERFTQALRPEPIASAAVETLYRDAVANPEDDAARSVLADSLLASGDVRGELMALQLADRDPVRVQQILQACARDWLGPLREVAYRVEYRRGLLARFELEHSWTAKQRTWAMHAQDPLLATVEELVPGARAGGAAYVEFLRSPVLAALRRIEVFDRDSAGGLAVLAQPIEHVSCAAWRRGRSIRPFAELVLPACERIASIRSLGIVVEAYTRLAKSPLRERITRLVVEGSAARVAPIWRTKPDLEELVITSSAALPACARPKPTVWEVRLARDGTTTACGAIDDSVFASLADLGRTRLELEVPEIPTSIARAAKAAGIELIRIEPRQASGFASRLHD